VFSNHRDSEATLSIGGNKRSRKALSGRRTRSIKILLCLSGNEILLRMKRVADVIADLIAQAEIRHVFMVTGGGAMHLNDALGRHEKLTYVACHHEQACTMAADSYFRFHRKPACVNVTTGPGGTNTITGVLGAWTDSVGMVIVSGQVKWETLVRSTDLPLRQLGDQEVDIIRMVESITKYAVIIKDPMSIRYHMEKAIYLSTHGRPGPVWVDVPIDIQAAPVDASQMKGFDPVAEGYEAQPAQLQTQVTQVLEKLKSAKRPVIMVGGGIRVSGTHERFLKLAEKLQIPIATCWNAHDVIWDEHPLYVGRPGSIGNRSGNFAVQNSDCVLILGSRLNIRQISYNFKSFARHAYKIMVDVDAAEMKKPTLNIDLPIAADLKDFFSVLSDCEYAPRQEHREWLSWCKERLAKYPTCLPEYYQLKTKVNPYCFVDQLFAQLGEDDWIVTGDGTACVVSFQAAKLKKGQRLFTNSGCASMGFDLPAAIGAHFAGPPKRLVCLAGDGSIQMNLQELQTLVTHKIPVKLFVLNNQGYHSIRQTQVNFFQGHVVGCGEESGLNFPDMKKLAAVFDIPFSRIQSHAELKDGIQTALAAPGIHLCEIVLDLQQSFAPKLSSKRLPDGRMVTAPLEDMFPFLSREELQSNMFYPVEGQS
jgi:acetolactate synthase-1/2/3 large subunit